MGQLYVPARRAAARPHRVRMHRIVCVLSGGLRLPLGVGGGRRHHAQLELDHGGGGEVSGLARGAGVAEAAVAWARRMPALLLLRQVVVEAVFAQPEIWRGSVGGACRGGGARDVGDRDAAACLVADDGAIGEGRVGRGGRRRARHRPRQLCAACSAARHAHSACCGSLRHQRGQPAERIRAVSKGRQLGLIGLVRCAQVCGAALSAEAGDAARELSSERLARAVQSQSAVRAPETHDRITGRARFDVRRHEKRLASDCQGRG